MRNPVIEEQLKAISKTIADALPADGWGFVLHIFSFGEGGSNFYASNARREDVITMLEEFLERQRAKGK